MKFLKLRHSRGNNGINIEDLKEFLNDSKAKLKKIACREATNIDTQNELNAIYGELYEINESIPADGSVPSNDIILRLIKVSERIEKLRDLKNACDEDSKLVISTIASSFAPIKNHFRSKAVSALC